MPSAPTKERGDSGAIAWGGILSTRDADHSAAWLPPTRWRTIDKMRRDPVVSAALAALTYPILSAPLDVEPADEREPQAVELADMVAEDLESMTVDWASHRYEALRCVGDGVALFETVFEKRGDGLFHLRKLAYRPNKTITEWLADENGGPAGVKQLRADGEPVTLDMDRLLAFSHLRAGGPLLGEPALRAMYRPWLMIDRLNRIAAIQAERSAGIPYAKTIKNMDGGKRSNLETMLASLHVHEQGYAIVDEDVLELGLLAPTGRPADVKPHLEHQRRDLLLAPLAQFLALGSDGVGSLALSRDHSELFLLVLQFIADEIEKTYNRYLIPRWIGYNAAVDKGLLPRLVHGPVGKRNAKEWLEAVKAATEAGVALPAEQLAEAAASVLGLELPETLERTGEQDVNAGDEGGDGPGEGGASVPTLPGSAKSERPAGSSSASLSAGQALELAAAPSGVGDLGADLVVLCGLPGSGKSTMVKGWAGARVVSPDALREARGGFGADESGVWAEAERQVREHLEAGRPVVLDATMTTRRRREPWAKLAAELGKRAAVVWVDVPADVARQRNAARSGGARVPDDALDRMASQFEPPTRSEGFSTVVRVAGAEMSARLELAAGELVSPHVLDAYQVEVDFVEMAAGMDGVEERIVNRLAKLQGKQAARLARIARRLVRDRDFEGLAELEVGSDEESEALEEELAAIAELGRQTYQAELESQDVDGVEEPDADALAAEESMIAALAAEHARALSDRMRTATGQAVMDQIRAGDAEGSTAAEVTAALAAIITAPGERLLREIARQGSGMAFGAGRSSVAKANADRLAFEVYSAVMDGNTCDGSPERCFENDGLEFPVGKGRPAPNPACLGGARCRCVRVPIASSDRIDERHAAADAVRAARGIATRPAEPRRSGGLRVPPGGEA